MKFLTTRRALGLSVRDHSLGAVQLRETGRGLVIEKAVFRPIEPPEELPTILSEFLREHDLRGETLVTSLPSSRASIREIPVNLRKRRLLDAAIKYQMEPLIPDPVENSVVGYMAADSGEPVLSFAVERGLLARHLECLSAAGLNPSLVCLEDLAFLALYRQTRGSRLESPAAILNLTEEGRTLLMLYRNRVDFVRVLSKSHDPAEGLRETLHFYGLKREGFAIAEILVTGAIEPGLLEAVSKATGTHAVLWRPFSEIARRKVEMDDALQSSLCLPLALAVNGSHPPPRGGNLLRDGFRPKGSNELERSLVLAASFFLLCVLLLMGSLYGRLQKQERYYAALRKEATLTLREAFPEMGHVMKGQELIQMRQKIAEEVAQNPGLNGVGSHVSLMELMQGLTRVLSSYPDATLELLSMEGKKVNMEGSISSFQVLDDLKTRLSETGGFESAKLGSARIDPQHRVVKFNMVLEMK